MKATSLFFFAANAGVILLFDTASSSFAASFDCSKAATGIEIKICANRAISSLDERMAHIYKYLTSAYKIVPLEDARSQLRTEQQHWLRNVRGKCNNIDCLTQVYNERIAQLEKAEALLLQATTSRERRTATGKPGHTCWVIQDLQGFNMFADSDYGPTPTHTYVPIKVNFNGERSTIGNVDATESRGIRQIDDFTAVAVDIGNSVTSVTSLQIDPVKSIGLYTILSYGKGLAEGFTGLTLYKGKANRCSN